MVIVWPDNRHIMRLIDDLRDRHRGRFRVSTGPPTPEERQKMRLGVPVFIVGLAVYTFTNSHAYAFFAMVATVDLLISTGWVEAGE